MTVVADTGALYAAFDADDLHHRAVADWLNASNDTPVVSPLVLAELDYLLARNGGERTRADAMAELTERVVVGSFTHATFVAAAGLAASYGELGIGLTDASVLLLARDHDTVDILTTDQRHFRAVRPPGAGKAYRLLPFDA
ncbi:MAG TPA: PIN domain-containing protein [Cryptosporangiaceae bacterium]|nr:PIN domain-containing protein [Cryptosporangiaceae bacterium]